MSSRTNQLPPSDLRRHLRRATRPARHHRSDPSHPRLRLIAARKFVASRTLREPLRWPNSTLLEGDAAEAVADLKAQPGQDLHIMGSGELVQSLMRRGLIDEFMLMIHPLVLGMGRRLFADGSPATNLRLVDTKTATTGVVIATYQPVESTPV
jgi:dihydrofolate reductase